MEDNKDKDFASIMISLGAAARRHRCRRRHGIANQARTE
jgi:hypothetical protein